MIRPCRLGSERGWQAGREAGSSSEQRRLHVEANVPFLPQEEGCRGGEEDVGHARERDREGEHPFNKTLYKRSYIFTYLFIYLNMFYSK